MPRERIYTRTGDDGTTGLLYGGRVRKDGEHPVAYGTVDEVQSVLGVARAHSPAGGELAELLMVLERDLWVLMSELATLPHNRSKLTPGTTLVTAEMVERLEHTIDDLDTRFAPPTEFVVPGETVLAAWLDLARAVTRRAERLALPVAPPPSLAIVYLNRLSDLLWTMARWQEGRSRTTRSVADPDTPNGPDTRDDRDMRHGPTTVAEPDHDTPHVADPASVAVTDKEQP